MITITLNTFENIYKKFHIEPRKTLGDMHIYFRGGGVWAMAGVQGKVAFGLSLFVY